MTATGIIPVNQVLVGDALKVLRTLPSSSVHCCVTSPPYYGLRNYGVEGQIGLEDSPFAFIQGVVDVFREVRRVLRKDGTLWINMGDTFASGQGNCFNPGGDQTSSHRRNLKAAGAYVTRRSSASDVRRWGLKPKDLMMMPARLALALQADGWYLRSQIVWHKSNCMPESVRDRPSQSYEMVYLFSSGPRYYYDWFGAREPAVGGGSASGTSFRRTDSKRAIPPHGSHNGTHRPNRSAISYNGALRRSRNVWTIPSEPYGGDHFATFPAELPARCIKAGTSTEGCCSECGAPLKRLVEPSTEYARHLGGWSDDSLDKAEGRGHFAMANGSVSNQRQVKRAPSLTAEYVHAGWARTCRHESSDIVPCVVLDPFLGSGTTALVAHGLGRDYIGIELNPRYARMARRRISGDTYIERVDGSSDVQNALPFAKEESK